MFPAAYPWIMAAAILAGGWLCRRSQRRLELSISQRWGIGVGAFCGAMLGSKLPFVVGDWQALVSGQAWFVDGKTILFGIVGGYLGVELAKWCLDVTVKTGDTFAVPVAVSVGIGRLGCFCAGCCYGTPSNLPWAVTFPFRGEVARHPTQIYEAIFHLFAAAGLAWMIRRRLLPGQLIKLYFIVYLAYRFASETIRPEARLWGGLTGYQWAAAVLLPMFVWLWVRDQRQLSDNLGQRMRAHPAD